MRKLDLSTSSRESFSLLLAVTLFGIIEAFEKEAISFNTARALLVRPFMLDKARRMECDVEVIKAIDMSLELDVAQRQFPQIIPLMIEEIKDILIVYISNAKIFPNEFVK